MGFGGGAGVATLRALPAARHGKETPLNRLSRRRGSLRPLLLDR